jgi:exosome complex component RRP46
MTSKSAKRKMKEKMEKVTRQLVPPLPTENASNAAQNVLQSSAVNNTEACLRPMSCEQHNLCQPDGSASFHQGRTSMMAAIYGPTEVRMARERADRATLEVVYKPKVGAASCTARTLEKLIRGTCDSVLLSALHPRTAFTIVVQELHDGGSMIACCINAVCAALLDSCAPMSRLFAAVHCAIDADGRLIIDPSTKAEKNAVVSSTFVFDSKEQDLLAVSSSGLVSDAQFQMCLAACRESSKQIFALYREIYSNRTKLM